MTGLAIATMIAICGVVWGGLVVLVVFAAVREGRKSREARGGADPS